MCVSPHLLEKSRMGIFFVLSLPLTAIEPVEVNSGN